MVNKRKGTNKKRLKTGLLKKLRSKDTKKTRMYKRRSTTKQVNLIRNGSFETGNFFPWIDVGEVFVASVRPVHGQNMCYFNVGPGRSASIRQRVFIGQSGPTGIYRLYFWASSPSHTGILQVSFLGAIFSPRIYRLSSIPNVIIGNPGQAFLYRIDIPRNAFRSSFFDLEFRVTGGSGTEFARLRLDQISLFAL